MRRRRDRLRPLEPIFKYEPRRGSVAVGNTPGSPPPPVLDDFYSVALSGPGYTIALEPDDSYAYVRVSGGIDVIDLADKTAPVLDNTFSHADLTGTGDMVRVGSWLYVCDTTNEQITPVDISTPTAPSIGTPVDLTAASTGGVGSVTGPIAVVGSNLFYAPASGGLPRWIGVVAITSPGSLSYSGETGIGSNVTHLWGADGRLWCGTSPGGSSSHFIAEWDLSSLPTVSSFGSIGHGGNGNTYLGLSANETNSDEVFIGHTFSGAGGEYLQLIDFSTPATPSTTWSNTTSFTSGPRHPRARAGYVYTFQVGILYACDTATGTPVSSVTIAAAASAQYLNYIELARLGGWVFASRSHTTNGTFTCARVEELAAP